MRTVLGRVVAGFLLLAPLGHVAMAQQAPADSVRTSTLKVFLDCQWECDFDYVRTELGAVNWVRARQDADVQVIVADDRTGAGGTQYTFTFVGLGRVAGLADTLKYSAPPGAAGDEVRKGMVQVLRVGLVRFVAHVSGASGVVVQLEAPRSDSAKATTKTVYDPWHAWVFSVSANGFGNGEELSKSLQTFGAVQANRVTEAWKTSLSINNNYSESRFTFEDGSKYLNVQRGNSANLRQVKSLTAHWSAGLTGALSTSTYLNQKLSTTLSPAIEYDVFPYKESTRRQLRLQYSLGVQHNSYEDTTIYFKTDETLVPQNLSAAYSTKQAWGSIDMSTSWRQYVNWGSKHSVDVFGGASLNLFKGFQLQLSGDYGQIHDQIYLPSTGYTPEEALLRQRQLATAYSYFVMLGFSYSFGSIYNNVVNPRFGSSGGGGMMMIMN